MLKSMLLLAALAGPMLAAAPAPAQMQSRDDRRPRPEILTAVAARDTMLRAGPDGDYPDVRRLPRGQPVAIMGCLADGRWCDVDLDGDRGWVAVDDLDGEDRGRPASIADLASAGRLRGSDFSIGAYWDRHYRQRPFYAQRQQWEQQYLQRHQASWGPRPDRAHWGNRPLAGTMMRRSWILAGPAWRYPHAGYVPVQGRVAINACLPDRSWCDISYRGARGWVAGTLVAVVHRGRRQTLATLGPRAGVDSRDFDFGDYWDDHYRDRDFYRERDRWLRSDGRSQSMTDDRPQPQPRDQ